MFYCVVFYCIHGANIYIFSLIPVFFLLFCSFLKAETGSGKTLAYLLPLVHKLVKRFDMKPITRDEGSFVIVITPTRELCQQIFSQLSALCQVYPRIVTGIVSGGDKKKSEKSRLRKGTG